jgi:uncharacterized protein YndB with AHSA1/START domain
MSTQTYELFLRADPQQVWNAITQGDKSAQYFFGTAVKLDGKRITWHVPTGDVLVEGDVISASAPNELVHTWRAHYDPTSSHEVSKVAWRLEPLGAMTKLTLVHELDGAPGTARSVGTNGWSLVLSGLKTLVETGSPLPPRPMA